MITITFPDNSKREYSEGVTPLDIANDISNRLAKEVLSATFNGEIIDAQQPINGNGELKLNKWEDDDGKHAFWHSSAHLLASALEQLFAGVKFWVGPALENGFYYDVDLPEGNQAWVAGWCLEN